MTHQIASPTTSEPVQRQESEHASNSLMPPGAASQLKIQEAANQSPQVQQLKSLQLAADESSQVHQLSSLQSSVGGEDTMQLSADPKSPIQRDAEGAVAGGLAAGAVGAGIGAAVAGPVGAVVGGLIGGVGGGIIGHLLTPEQTIDDFLAEIEAKTTAERQAILNDANEMDATRAKFNGNDLVLAMNALLEGSQEWRNPTGNDFYNHFVTNGLDTALPTDATMNCWESVLYSAFLANEIDGDYIRDFYQTALAGADANQLIWQQLGYHAGLPEYPATTPRAGQFLFYITDGDAYPGHIALSHGGDEAISLWWKPNNVDAVQRIQVNDLVENPNTKVLVADPTW